MSVNYEHGTAKANSGTDTPQAIEGGGAYWSILGRMGIVNKIVQPQT
jgi:hypothetical protein